jgi:hypothetical protein
MKGVVKRHEGNYITGHTHVKHTVKNIFFRNIFKLHFFKLDPTYLVNNILMLKAWSQM